MTPTDYVFISHVEEDREPALAIAELLESVGYATWTYELDSMPGTSYLVETTRAVEGCGVFLLVVSHHALPSIQLPKEIVSAHEAGKMFLPVLCDIGDAEFKAARQEWKAAVGSATSIAYDDEDPEDFRRRVVAGLARLGVTPRPAPDRSRIESLRRVRARLVHRGPRAPVAPAPVPPPPAPAPVAAPRGARRWPALAAGLLVVAGALGWWGTYRPPEVVLGVMDIKRQGKIPDWMPEFTRDGLNSVLNDLGKVRVYSKQKIDFIRAKRGLSEIEAAEELGITCMISGTLSAASSKLILQLQVVDIARNGMLIGDAQVRGTEERLLEMQNEAAFAVLKRLRVDVGEADRKRVVASRTNDLQEYYELLAGTMGDVVPTPPHDGAPGGSPVPTIPPGAWLRLGPRPALAAEGPDEVAVRALLDRYRAALESKDMDRLGTVYVSLTDTMRRSLTEYFRNAADLKVQFSDYDILVEGDEALATFTRVDSFTDTESARPVQLRVQVNSIVAKQGADWKIKTLRRPTS